MRLIDADALPQRKYFRYVDHKLEYVIPVECIDNAPTIEPPTKLVTEVRVEAEKVVQRIKEELEDCQNCEHRRKHGEWKHDIGDKWYCSCCFNVIHTEGSWEKPTKKFCVECGADMREEIDIMYYPQVDGITPYVI